MKIKNDYILRNTAGTWVAMVISADNADVDGVLTLNETGALLWKALERECEAVDLVRILMEQYEIDEQEATADVSAFIEKLSNFGCLV